MSDCTTDVINRIIKSNEKLMEFWSKCEGWPPQETWHMLQKCNMKRQVELSETLHIWNNADLTDAILILAWTNLGALVEGSLKLYLTTYYLDYKVDLNKIVKRQKLQDPFDLNLEDLKVFFQRKEIIHNNGWFDFISFIQVKRNTIHAFKHRDIGTRQEFEEHLKHYLFFIYFIDQHLNYPEPLPLVGRGLLFEMYYIDSQNWTKQESQLPIG